MANRFVRGSSEIFEITYNSSYTYYLRIDNNGKFVEVSETSTESSYL